MHIKKVISYCRNDERELAIEQTRHLSGAERISLLEDLRQNVYSKVKHGYSRRLRRVIEIIERKKH